MDGINSLFLLTGLLLFLSVISTTLSARLGLPLLLMFLGVGIMQTATGWVASWAQSQGIEPYRAVMSSIALALALGSSALRWLPAPPLLDNGKI